jgi:hypothetical protein
MEKLVITSDTCETVNIMLDPVLQPIAFKRAVQNLVDSGATEKEAEQTILLQGFEMEVMYKENCGLFAVEAEAVGCTPISDPYTHEVIPYDEDTPNFLEEVKTRSGMLKAFNKMLKEDFCKECGKTSDEYDNTKMFLFTKMNLKIINN